MKIALILHPSGDRVARESRELRLRYGPQMIVNGEYGKTASSFAD